MTALNSDVEVIMTFPRPTCPKPPNIPIPNSLALVGTLYDTVPILCGNTANESFCFDFDLKRFDWTKQLFKMDQSRMQAAVAQIDASSWIVLGGQIYNNGAPLILNTSTIFQNGTFLAGPYLPMPIFGLCAISIGNGQILLVGGKDSQLHNLKVTYMLFFDKLNGLVTWTNLQMMSTGRYGHSCGKAKYFNAFEIIVAGGLRENTVEIYLLDKAIWIEGPILERQVFSAANLQGETTFLIIGGMELEPFCTTKNCRLKTIHAYNRIQNTWVEKTISLNQGRRNHVAIHLPLNVDCSSKYVQTCSIFYIDALH